MVPALAAISFTLGWRISSLRLRWSPLTVRSRSPTPAPTPICSGRSRAQWHVRYRHVSAYCAHARAFAMDRCGSTHDQGALGQYIPRVDRTTPLEYRANILICASRRSSTSPRCRRDMPETSCFSASMRLFRTELGCRSNRDAIWCSDSPCCQRSHISAFWVSV